MWVVWLRRRFVRHALRFASQTIRRKRLLSDRPCLFADHTGSEKGADLGWRSFGDHSRPTQAHTLSRAGINRARTIPAPDPIRGRRARHFKWVRLPWRDG